MAFGVATHVSLSHLGLEKEALGRPRAVSLLAGALLLALTARVIADWSESYFDHIGWAAAFWIVGTTIWLAYLGPKLLRR